MNVKSTTIYYGHTANDYAKQELTSAEKSSKKNSNKTIAVTTCFIFSVITTYRGPGVLNRIRLYKWNNKTATLL